MDRTYAPLFFFAGVTKRRPESKLGWIVVCPLELFFLFVFVLARGARSREEREEGVAKSHRLFRGIE